MQLDLIKYKSDDMLDRWWGSFSIVGKPNPASSIPFPWFYDVRGPKTLIGVVLEAKSIELAESMIELYMDLDIDDVRWQRELGAHDESIEQIYRYWFSCFKFNVPHMAKFGIKPPEPEPMIKKKKVKKKARRR